MADQPPGNKSPAKPSGASVYRGPMAEDNFTQIHNLVVRGKTPIHTRYVGVWGFITSHTEGWKLTETSIARELGVGVDFVRSALTAIETAGCLIRTRHRDAQGKLGDSAWFVTDLPIQLQQLGVTDPEVLTAKVDEAYEQWRNSFAESATADAFPSAAPTSENSTLGMTSENSDQLHPEEGVQQRFPSAAPNSDFPSLDEPSLAHPATKKTNQKKTKGKKTNQPPDAGAAASDPDGDGWMDSSAQTHKTEHTGQVTAGAKLVASLERRYRAHLHGGRDRHIRTVDEALAVLTQTEVTSALSDGLDTARQPSGALVRRIEGLPERVVARQTQQKDRAVWERRVEERAERRQADPIAPEQPAQPEASPVDWLTDEQYSALSPQDKAHLRAWSNTSEEELTLHAADRLAAIRNRLTNAE